MHPVSVIVVSNGRPEALKRCLTAVRQLDYANFEIVVVADGAAIRVLESSPQRAGIKVAVFEDENISAARNLGIGLAAGEVVAFLDDDAVPEPTWIRHLSAAFDDPEVAAAGGFVRARNGISWQWQAASVDGHGQRHALTLESSRALVLHPAGSQAIKTEGTNMAFRRDVLTAMGGFDPAFRFFLDETDLNLRLARAGHATAIVPLAEVHHGFAASGRRRADRAPRDLFEIGASYAAFLVRHCPPEDREECEATFADEQRKRVLRHMVDGRLEPRDLRRLLARLQDGMAEGRQRAPMALPTLPHPSEAFLPLFRDMQPDGRHHCGRWRNRAALRRRAAHDVAAGHVTTLMIFSFTALFGSVRFREAGFWEHRGGQFGRSERDAPLFTLRKLSRKCREEYARVAAQRGL